MHYSEILEKYLYRIARGELDDTAVVLPLLLKTNVFVGGKVHSDSDGTVSLVLTSFNRDGVDYIPVYLRRTSKPDLPVSAESDYSEDLLNSSSEHSSRLIELNGEALIKVLPYDVGIVVEPSTSLEVLFTSGVIHETARSLGNIKILDPDEMPEEQFVKSDESYNISTNSEKVMNLSRYRKDVDIPHGNRRGRETEIIHHEKLSLNEQESPDESRFGINLNLFDEDDSSEFSHDKDLEELSASLGESVNIAEVEESLVRIYQNYPEIAESFLLRHNSPDSELVLGVLLSTDSLPSGNTGWSSERRFDFVEEVSYVARRYFGYASAIELYDDLHDTGARSWDLFKVLSPFYVRETNLQDFSEKFKSSSGQVSSVGYPTENVSGRRLRARDDIFEGKGLANQIEISNDLQNREPRKRNPTSGRLGLRESVAKIGSGTGNLIGGGLKLFGRQAKVKPGQKR
ncbi:MAG TPA: hypothetical protein PKA63_09940 [Oligoflexia bacterium]|nr:hypothetical protein [Oligoflexia bacterium]HMP48976.1 hypothetical protein [Oligoflexia bacterium]